MAVWPAAIFMPGHVREPDCQLALRLQVPGASEVKLSTTGQYVASVSPDPTFVVVNPLYAT